jgi:hypothetical protein
MGSISTRISRKTLVGTERYSAVAHMLVTLQTR